MQQAAAPSRVAAIMGKPRRALVDLVWLLGLGALGLALSGCFPDGLGGLAGIVATLGWVAGFVIAGLRAEPGRLVAGVLRLWAAVSLTMLAVGCIWFLWVVSTIRRPLSEFYLSDAWHDALGMLFVALWLGLCATVPAILGGGLAWLIRRRRGARGR